MVVSLNSRLESNKGKEEAGTLLGVAREAGCGFPPASFTVCEASSSCISFITLFIAYELTFMYQHRQLYYLSFIFSRPTSLHPLWYKNINSDSTARQLHRRRGL